VDVLDLNPVQILIGHSKKEEGLIHSYSMAHYLNAMNENFQIDFILTHVVDHLVEKNF